jgi:DNA repair exonuclease SbcCD ATPase subunit
MSGEFMSVHLELDNGAANANFEINETQEHELPWLVNRKEIPLLNASAYFGMTERERYQYVFNISKTPESFTAQAVCDTLRDIHFEQSGTEEAKKSMINYVADAFVNRSIQEGLQGAIDKMAELFKQSNARSKDTQGAIRVLTELKNQQEAMAGNSKQFGEAERAAMQVAKDAWDALNLLRRRAIDAQKFQERRESMKRLAEASNDTSEIEKLELRIKEATAQLKPNVEAKYSEADLGAFKWAHSEALRMFNEYSTELRNRKEQQEELETRTACPYCESKARGWKEHLGEKLREGILFYDGALKGASITLEERKTEMELAEAEVRRVREELAHNKVLNGNILNWQGQIDTAKRQQKQRNEVLEREQKELAETTVEPVASEELAAAEAANTKAETDYKEARTKLRFSELLEQDIKRAAQAELEHRTAAAHVVVIKAIGKVLREKQAALVEKVFGDLLHVANGIVGEILPSDLAFHEGEVGRWNKHQWISHKTFSGTEQALTFVAIAAALSQGAPIRLLIFDEMGRLDEARRALLMNVLHRALEDGWIDQWIIAGTKDSLPIHIASDIQLIEL